MTILTVTGKDNLRKVAVKFGLNEIMAETLLAKAGAALAEGMAIDDVIGAIDDLEPPAPTLPTCRSCGEPLDKLVWHGLVEQTQLVVFAFDDGKPTAPHWHGGEATGVEYTGWYTHAACGAKLGNDWFAVYADLPLPEEEVDDLLVIPGDLVTA